MIFFSIERDGEGHDTFVVSHRWWLFLAIAVPLTICVFVIWEVWRKRRAAQRESEWGVERMKIGHLS